MNKCLLQLILVFFLVNPVLSQDFPCILPLSPNAASIIKYGEIPVGYFTGVPSIGIPLYTIESRELSLPLSLSYHAGGNKVESIASWVGLGWTIGTIPSISRSVRGIPDENNGYFYKYNEYTVEEIWDIRNSNTFLYNTYRSHLYSGDADSEPDIFSYNLPRESEKIFYNQENEVFINFPKSNIKITRNGDDFTLVTQNGVEYNFC